MATVKGTNGADIIGGRSGATNDADSIYGYDGPDKLYGVGGDDHIYGGDDKDEIHGGNGQDYLFGEDGDDTIYGDDGNDFLCGGPGADVLDGGASTGDLADYATSPSGVIINLITGNGSGGDATGDQLTSIEGVYGSQYDDTFFGDDNGNSLSGEGGTDTIKGFGGDDYIWGGNDADTLYGMDGTDLIHGNAGKDWISGGAGQDSLFGDEGADRFVWSSTADAPNGASYNVCNTDVVCDFDVAEGDVIDLSAIDADVYAAGNQTFTFIGAAPFSGTPGELGYVHYCGSTFILMQTDTSPDAEGVIRLPGIVTPQASWFEP